MSIPQVLRCAYGEHGQATLRFLCKVMGVKTDPAFPFQGRA
ncbi:hypothetical protein PO883_17845 [Massilia sp. DJPM01]|nr:hypothetical protein [Massilia sp. DJPM01]MDM5179063.1 hypothetical protein [Massilia sp. DJPM01]